MKICFLTKRKMKVYCSGMKKSETVDQDQNAILEKRRKFERIEKIEINPLVSGPTKRSSLLQDTELNDSALPDLRSPDERNPHWVPDPDEIAAIKRAESRKARRAKIKNEAKASDSENHV